MKKFIVILIIGLMGISMASAKDNSPWREVQVVEIPASTQIYQGTTKNGNPKFWIEIGDIKVTVSQGNATKFKNGEVKLEMVKWYNDTTKKFKYSTRQRKGSNSSKKSQKDVDLTRIF